jgi:hypothetical protein
VLSVVGTSLGLWPATLAAEIQSFRIAHGRMTHAAELRHMLSATSPRAGAWTAVASGLANLFIGGIVIAVKLSARR